MTTATADTTAGTAYDRLIGLTTDAELIGSTASVLNWDQHVLMPRRGLEHRSLQLAQLARLRHELMTSSRVGELIEECLGDSNLMSDPESPVAVNVREIARDYRRATKLPPALVEEESRLSSIGEHVWAEARAREDFSHFQPSLEKIVDLLRRKAECYGWADGGEPWDALAEDYETGCTAAGVAAVFDPLRERLQSLLDDIMGSSTPPSNRFNEIEVPIEDQRRLVRWVAEQYGFSFDRGRLDESTHPFCGGSHCDDVRMTTRFHVDNVNDALGSTMHETGHGLYEQGLLAEHIGSPMGEAVSLGIHESQSRMWENQVGRSPAFWRWMHPKLAEYMGPTAGITFDEAYGGANIVRPDYIRVEADEATYNMHIMIRFDLERAILSGDLAAGDIPGAWNEKYLTYLGLTVPTAAKGCLQDIHWSMAAMGYFPTYTLGNLYCAQFFETAQRDLGGLDADFERGEFSRLLTWLRENIHCHGRRYRPSDLCERVTGAPLSADPLMRHLEGKLRPLYGI